MRLVAMLALAILPVCALAQTDATTPPPSQVLQRLEAMAPPVVELKPAMGVRDLRVSGDARAIYNAIGSAFGIRMSFDEGMPARSTTFLLEKADFATAMDVASQITKTFWIPRSPREVLVAADTAAKRREHDRVLLRTFYLPGTTTTQELNDYATVLRSVLELRSVQVQPANSSIVVRGPYASIVAAERLLAGMDDARPQVALEVQVFEIDRTMLRAVGIDLPLQFQLFNIGTALAGLGDGNVQDLINQLLQQGTLTPENLAALGGLLGQLQNQNSALFANPLATFGGGLTLFGIGVPPVSARFLREESRAESLQKVTLRASQGNAATLHIGTRHPIVTQSFSSGVSIPGIDLPIGDVRGVVPGFQYEDLGVSLKATPQVHGDARVTLALELAVKSLGPLQGNGNPVIHNREYKGMITSSDGEAVVMAGIISQSESRAMRGMPGLSKIPALGRLVSSETINQADTELLVLITPRVTRKRAGTPALISVPAPR